jgi:hypothetical protein
MSMQNTQTNYKEKNGSCRIPSIVVICVVDLDLDSQDLSVCFRASRIRILRSTSKNSKKNLYFYYFLTSIFFTFIYKNWCNWSSKSNEPKNCGKNFFFVGILSATDEIPSGLWNIESGSRSREQGGQIIMVRTGGSGSTTLIKICV